MLSYNAYERNQDGTWTPWRWVALSGHHRL